MGKVFESYVFSYIAFSAEEGLAKLTIAKTTTKPLDDFSFPVYISFRHSFYPFSSDFLRYLLFHLSKDKTPFLTITLVELQYCMSCCSRTCKGIKN